MFDIKNSKLYSQIMEGLAVHFSMDKANTTESELHARLETEKPISEQLEAAKNDGAATAANDIAELKSRMSEMESKLAAQASDIEAKVGRIAELETEITAAKETATIAQTALDTKVKEYDAKVLELSGEVARYKTGQKQEQEGNDPTHDASKPGAAPSNKPIAVSDAGLKNLLTKRTEN